MLVKHGADINAWNSHSHTPLYYAAKHGYRNAAEKLITLGADKNTLGEINYGKAPQLSAKLKKGEAYLRYMTAGDYAVKTAKTSAYSSAIIEFQFLTGERPCQWTGQSE